MWCNAAALVWDTLYGVDRALKSQRQMIDVEEVSAQGRTWTFRLRADLKFHDGEPVRAKDAVASINRWAARDATGAMGRHDHDCWRHVAERWGRCILVHRR